MRFTLIFLFLTVTSLAKGQTINDSTIRFDGFYKTKAEVDKKDNDTTYEYLRFYSTGSVISVCSEGTADDLKIWFNPRHDNVEVGSYKIIGKKLYFSTTAKGGGGTVIYKGKIKNQYYLILRSKSLINGYRGRDKFYFVAVPDLN
jgi:hypothetical protein